MHLSSTISSFPFWLLHRQLLDPPSAYKKRNQAYYSETTINEHMKHWDMPYRPCNKCKRNNRQAGQNSPVNDPLVSYRILYWPYECHCNNNMRKCQPVKTISKHRIF